jgi:hypothetical protein
MRETKEKENFKRTNKAIGGKINNTELIRN